MLLSDTSTTCHSTFIPSDALKTLLHAFVASRLDYCNSLFMVCQVAILGSFNWSRMLLQDCLVACPNLTMFHPYCVHFTGCLSNNALTLKLLYLPTNLFTNLLQNTFRICVIQFLNSSPSQETDLQRGVILSLVLGIL